MGMTFHKTNNGEIRIGLLATAVFLSVMAVILVLVIAHEQYLAVYEQDQFEQRQIGENPELRQLRSREAELLDTTEVIDLDSSEYRIPVKRAMELISTEADN